MLKTLLCVGRKCNQISALTQFRSTGSKLKDLSIVASLKYLPISLTFLVDNFPLRPRVSRLTATFDVCEKGRRTVTECNSTNDEWITVTASYTNLLIIPIVHDEHLFHRKAGATKTKINVAMAFVTSMDRSDRIRCLFLDLVFPGTSERHGVRRVSKMSRQLCEWNTTRYWYAIGSFGCLFDCPCGLGFSNVHQALAICSYHGLPGSVPQI